jgi:hypothetical protein
VPVVVDGLVGTWSACPFYTLDDYSFYIPTSSLSDTFGGQGSIMLT